MNRKRDTLTCFTKSRDILKNTPEYQQLVQELQNHIDSLTADLEEQGEGEEDGQNVKTESTSLSDVLIYAGIATVIVGAIAATIIKLRRH